MSRTTTAAAIRESWRSGKEIALLDVREEGPFSEAHPLFACSLPLSQIEMRILDLVPRLDAPVVVYDDGEGDAEKAESRIAKLGYENVSVLAGGLRGYAKEGELYRDVNSASKAFGELVECIRHTPSLSATEVDALQKSGADMVVLDVRPFGEYTTMNIPNGISVPGAELALRAREIAPSKDTLLVVNCAGRTRGIIGTQSLINSGLPNRVAALRYGTIGWTLAGKSLETGQTRRYGELGKAAHEEARKEAKLWAAHVGVRMIAAKELDAFRNDKTRTLYCFDVRSPEEYAAAHPAGFLSAPGGQLVQANDEWVGVRGARIVLFDDDGVRARMTASWLVQMGWDAVVLEAGAIPASEMGVPAPKRPALPKQGIEFVSATALAAEGAQATIVDLARSSGYRKQHIPGAHFVLASRFAADLAAIPGSGPITLTSADGDLAIFSCADAVANTKRPVRVLAGGTTAWKEAKLPVESEKHSWISKQIDVYKRPYEGTDNAQSAMQAYLDWEAQLVAQLANDGVSRFHVVREAL
jgi:rhodanese-related sulfurtransferase